MFKIGSLLSSVGGLKGKLLVAAVALVVGGVSLNSVESDGEASPSTPSKYTTEPSTGSALIEYSSHMRDSAPQQTKGATGTGSTWGDAAIRIGLSFGVAMLFATLLRGFIKTLITTVLLVAGVSWLLHQQGYIEPYWENVMVRREEIGAWAASQFETIKGFVAGVFPSSGAAIAGFLFGFKKS